MQIQVAQNVGKAWISRKKNLPASGFIWSRPNLFSPWTKKIEKYKIQLFSLVSQWTAFHSWWINTCEQRFNRHWLESGAVQY